MKGVKKLKSVSLLWCSVTGQKAKGVCGNTRMKDKNTLLIGNQIVQQAALIGCGVSRFGDNLIPEWTQT